MEFVYVAKRYDLFERSFPHGLELRTEEQIQPFLARVAECGFFVERRHAELDSTLKQIIPYCVISRGESVFLTRRLAAGGEKRLHGKRSIGIGGHVNPVDGLGGADVLREGLRRELDEELVLTGSWSARPVGVLNDDSTDVGSVHLGLVNVVAVAGDVTVRETETLEGGFLPLAEVERLCAAERGSFESWSALVIDRLRDVLP